jgi:hypothetical protein
MPNKLNWRINTRKSACARWTVGLALRRDSSDKTPQEAACYFVLSVVSPVSLNVPGKTLQTTLDRDANGGSLCRQ